MMSCSPQENGYLDKILDMEAKDDTYTSESIQDIEKSIKKYQKEVERKMEATAQLGIYYKMLAAQYMENSMFNMALDSLKSAIEIYNENPILFFLSGVCAGNVSRSVMVEEEKDYWIKQSFQYYSRAIQLDSDYVDALYGLAVLLIFEMGMPEQAISHLETVNKLQRNNIDAMFLLARAYYETGSLEAALELYSLIISLTKVEKTREQAEVNKSRIETELYGR